MPDEVSNAQPRPQSDTPLGQPPDPARDLPQPDSHPDPRPAPVPPLPPSVSFLSDAEGAKAYWSKHLKSLHGLPSLIRKESLAHASTSSLIFMVVGVFWMLTRADNSAIAVSLPVLSGITFFGVCLLAHSLSAGPWGRWRRTITAFIDAASDMPPHAVTVSLMPDGYTVEFAEGARVTRWAAVGEIVLVDRWIVIYHIDGTVAISIPLSAFPTDADAHAWLARAQELIDSSGYGRASRTRAALAHGPVYCGRCRYALVGARGTSCPECGVELSPRQIEVWRAAQLPGKIFMIKCLGFRR